MSREKYCKFCGRELDEGKCSCNAFLLSQNKERKSKKERTYIVCDTCGAKVESDANFCTNCGLPLHADGKIEELQKELQGIGAPDVIDVYAIKDNKKKQKNVYSLPLIAMIALATFVFGIAIGLVIKPKIDSFIRNMSIRDSLELGESLDSSTTSDSPTTINGPTVNEEIQSPTEGTKKKRQDSEESTSSVDSNSKNNTNESETQTIEASEVVNNDKVETAEESSSTRVVSDKKNLIDKTTKAEPETIKKETETSITEATSVTNTAINGEIKGLSDEDKKKSELYIQSLRSIRDTITKNGEVCEISYFAPVLAGKDEEEVKIVNAAYTYAFDLDFHEILKNIATSSSELPLSIVFTEVEQKNITKNRLFIVTHGKVTPRSGLTIKIRYRALYDRREHTVKFEKIVE